MIDRRLPLVIAAIAMLSACKTPKETSAASGQPAEPAAQPAVEAPAQPGSATAKPVESAVPQPEPAASAPAEEPLPDVAVKNIGMHIGGGPNDRDTKRPIKESVEPHFDALRRCWKLVEDRDKSGDFGVDLLIPREGGKAEVSHPRSALKGDGFEACVVDVFAGIDFKKPKTGKTMVSYSIRFTPDKGSR